MKLSVCSVVSYMHNGLLRHTHSPTIDLLLQTGLILDFINDILIEKIKKGFFFYKYFTKSYLHSQLCIVAVSIL
jgi:hypothetical protein